MTAGLDSVMTTVRTTSFMGHPYYVTWMLVDKESTIYSMLFFLPQKKNKGRESET